MTIFSRRLETKGTNYDWYPSYLLIPHIFQLSVNIQVLVYLFPPFIFTLWSAGMAK